VAENFVYVPSPRLSAEGLSLRDLSPLSSRWVSHLDNSYSRDELGLFHDPYKIYLSRIVSSFLATLPKEKPAGYLQRPQELAAFARL
jgi:hypothetical protein